MPEYLQLAKKRIEEGWGSTEALALVSIAESLERLADKFAPACESYDAEEEEEC